MRKILLSLIFIFAISSCSYGTVSEDMSVYVRQDVFDAKMEAFMSEIRGEFQVINAKLEALDKRITDVETHLSNRITDIEKNTSNQIADIEKNMSNRITDIEKNMSNRITDIEKNMSNRIDDLKTMVYWGFSLIGLLVSFAILAPSLGEFLRTLRKPSFTLEDVKRLIEENNLRMNNRVQV